MRTLIIPIAFWATFLFAWDLAWDQAPELLVLDSSQSLSGLNSGLDSIEKERDGSSLDIRSLLGRQLTCPVARPVLCGNGCCLATYNCVQAGFRCCPKTAQTCGGSFCYEAGAGMTCCNNGEGCCTDGETCCPGGCCPAGYTCSTEPGMCQRIQATQKTQTQTQTRTQSSKSQTIKSSATTTQPKLTTPKLSTIKTQSTTTTGCKTATGISQPTSASLPVMEFTYVGNGIADDIPTNICLGIRHKLGISAQEIVLTRALDGKKCSNARGRASGCPRCCAGVRKLASSLNAGDATQCDEFPFRSTIEGGAGAWIRCVTDWHNTLQGAYINSWYADHGVGAGDQFIVRVVNLDCTTVKSTDLQSCNGAIVRPRDEPDELRSGSETTTHRTLDNRTNAVVAPLGDLEGGGFRATARMVGGRLKNLALIDSDGEEILPLNSLDALYNADGLVIDWELDDYVGGIGLLGETETTSVNLTWKLTNSTGPETEAGTGTDSPNNGSVKGTSSVLLVLSFATLMLYINLLQFI
ncbi:hypothetical protein GQX73_g5857 [Xylaria multiplex]|uniref:Deoxyribonuclease NucA/NucB domain-containing protein n=1 Tax=Xylaria multiplex TaxID=323545 RepID=A0A7C8MT35_9PEZI|nr:hypothetical protein GQX73_g5857 [Xylaria multiplex]